MGEDKFKHSNGTYYEHAFNKQFKEFTKAKFEEYSDRKELLQEVSRQTGNEAHRVVSISGHPFKVHFFGELIEAEEYRYVVRSGLLFTPHLCLEHAYNQIVVLTLLPPLSEVSLTIIRFLDAIYQYTDTNKKWNNKELRWE